MGDMPTVVKPATQPPRPSRAEHVSSDTKPATSDIVVAPSDAPCPSPPKIVISSRNRIDIRKWKFTPIYVEENEETWSRVISNANVMRRNVLQLPRGVIKKSLSGPISSIELYGSEKGISENCVVKVRNNYEGEKYLMTGWYEFAKQEELKK
ncbi:unnamed protein product [Vicia faba]|uniref:Uncharacterized protein n=1 Tax=Vicia faba TaxID=3906 RepID=A0AAV0ZMB9_VICFA|nr:unnamed protein product [Vicia faba]